MTIQTTFPKIILICFAALCCVQFAHGQPKEKIFNREARRINKLYQALLSQDTARYHQILRRIESTEAPQYLISIHYMVDMGQAAYRILIGHDNEAYPEYCKLYPLIETLSPKPNKPTVRYLKNAVEKNMIVIVP